MNAAELKKVQRGIVQNAIISGVFCSGMLAAGYYVLPQHFVFPADLAERLAFAVQVSFFIFIWVIVAVRMVSRIRFYSPEDSRGSAYTIPSAKIAVPRAFLQNTLEQSVIAVGGYFALATLVTGPLLGLLPSAAVLFSVGRVAFLWGYSAGAAGRAFGMVTTVLPSMIIYGFALYFLAFKLF